MKGILITLWPDNNQLTNWLLYK